MTCTNARGGRFRGYVDGYTRRRPRAGAVRTGGFVVRGAAGSGGPEAYVKGGLDADTLVARAIPPPTDVGAAGRVNDPYAMPNGVLRDKRGITDHQLFAAAEADIIRARLVMLAERPCPARTTSAISKRSMARTSVT